MRQIADTVIIGAGMAGASFAYELAHRGNERIVVIERETQPGYHATGRSAALWARLYGHQIMQTFTSESLDFLTDPPDGFCDGPLLRPRGVLLIGRRDQKPEFEAYRSAAEAAGIALEDVSGQAAGWLVPILSDNWTAHALYDRQAFDIDVHTLLQGYVRGARRGGVEFVNDDEAVALKRGNGDWQIDTRQGMSISAPVIVNAAGAWADAVAIMAGARPLELIAKRRTGVIVAPPADTDVTHWPAVGDLAESFYFKPDAGKLMVSPADATPTAAADARPDELDIAVAVDRYCAATSQRVDRVEHSWAGLRTFARDGIPVIGFDRAVEGFFWLAGQGGTGIQTAPALSRYAAALLTGDTAGIQDSAVSPDAVSPDRLLANTATRH